MAEPLEDQIARKIANAHELYYRLILVIGPTGSGKTKALQKVSASASAPLINVNLDLSRGLLDLPTRRRALQASRLLGDIIDEAVGDLVLLDNTELLFDVALKLDPLRLLQSLSRNKTLVVAWNGAIGAADLTASSDQSSTIAVSTANATAHAYLHYAVQGHPEYRRYPVSDLLIVRTTLPTRNR
ncbi:MAG TPA: BREX-3 system P-loop-containing protein BrxF [Anaerolineae bacterium]|nr:BREX-3 system P-loop-containing protein BrxF [Anaerolineae bacterium]